MKKWFTIAAFALSNLASAAGYIDLLYPPLASLKVICNDAFLHPDYDSATVTKHLYFYADDPKRLVIQSPSASAFSVCAEASRNHEPKPDITRTKAPFIAVLTVGGSVAEDLDLVQGWTAALVVSVGGKEVVQLPFDETESSVGQIPDWEVKCVSGACTWSGISQFYFDLRDAKFKAAIARPGAVLSFILSRGNGPERFVVPADFQAARAAGATPSTQAAVVAPAQPSGPARINPSIAYVSLREVTTRFGQFMGLESTATKQPRLTVAGTAYTLPAGNNKAFLTSGQTITLPAPVVQRGGTTYVPARFFASLGCVVNVSPSDARTINISCKNSAGETEANDFERY